MTKTLRRIGWLVGVLTVATAASTCATREREASTSRRANLITGNGLDQNGLSTNGIWNNGIWNNGIWNNGIWNNGIWNNGIWNNGIWNNGIWNNGIWNNGAPGSPEAAPGEALRSSSYARQLLQYLYSCAMPATTYDTTLDPNLASPIPCSEDIDCDTAYACVENKCVIPLRGGGANGSGLGVNFDGSTWWGSGTCDESCQRWVSACLLARTNAYGVHVQISMRAPSNAPQAVKDAIAVAGDERAAYDLPEGSYYGNLFATTPTTPAPTGGTGEATGPVASTPQYYACAGRGSNIPAITRRFCSSQGDQTVIAVPGFCRANGLIPGACAGEDTDPASDTFGAIQSCRTTAVTGPQAPCADYRDPNCYDQIITVYLAQPIAVCGNDVCEDDGTPSSPETTASCPSDCHDGWAHSYDETVGLESFAGYALVSPNDDTVVLAGRPFRDVDISLGGPVLPAVGAGDTLVAKYTRDGAYVWGVRFSMPGTSVDFAVAGDGTITVVAWHGGGGLATLTRLSGVDGHTLPGWPIFLGEGASMLNYGTITADAAGNLFVAGTYSGAAAFASTPPTAIASTTEEVFVIKLLPDGTPAWAVSLPGWDQVVRLSVAPSGDLLVLTGFHQASGATEALIKLSQPPGGAVAAALLKSSSFASAIFSSVVADGAGELYATGELVDSYDFGPGCGTAAATTAAGEFFLVKYAPDGVTCRWLARGVTTCPDNAIYCPDSRFFGIFAKLDPEGNVLVGGRLDGTSYVFGDLPPGTGALLNLGAGVFESYRYADTFVASYSAGGDFRWAKHIPYVLIGGIQELGVDSRGHVVVSGNYEGSMLVDDRLLVQSFPTSIFSQGTFVASFAPPSPSDTGLPRVGEARDSTGAPVLTVPLDIYAQATSAAGAVVFFMPPTAIDEGNAGTTVACSPPPNTTFPLGATPVTCTATDPVGNSSNATFSVTVVDTLGPVFSAAPNVPLVVPPIGATETVVTYAPPTATDQVDGPRPVACAPASGSVFSAGRTTVTCTSSDTRGNTSSISFTVSVADTIPPVLTLPGPITATATCVNGAIVTYSATAFDAVDGVVVPVCTPASGSKFPLGATTVNCTATDAAGNQASGSFQVNVQYAWSGVLPPINADGSSVFKLGSTVPVKFALTGASAGVTNAVAKLTLAKVSATVTGSDIEAISTSAATTGNLFRYSGGQYIFNLSTKGLSAGTWRLSIDLGDGVSRTVLISLR